MMNKQHNLFDLFTTFLKIGALTFGGGYAMMPVMRKEIVEKKQWADDDDILKILVISETTPGVLSINSATFIGYKIAGFKGSCVATLGVIIPSFVIISIISLFLYWSVFLNALYATVNPPISATFSPCVKAPFTWNVSIGYKF